MEKITPKPRLVLMIVVTITLFISTMAVIAYIISCKMASYGSMRDAIEHDKMLKAPEAYLKISKFSWTKEARGTAGRINITFTNSGIIAASDIVVLLSFESESGRATKEKKMTFPCVVKPKESITVRDISYGFIGRQYKRCAYRIVEISFEISNHN